MFHYEATDASGKTLAGSMDARDEGAVRVRLAQDGYTPIMIESATGARTTTASGNGHAGAAPPSPARSMGAAGGASYQAPPGATFQPQPEPRKGRRPRVNVSTRSLAEFYRQMAASVKSGVPMTQTIPSIAARTSDRRLREAVLGIGQSVERGRPISEAMDLYPHVFSAGHVGLIRAGEGGGYLDRAFNELAAQAESDWGMESATKFNIILFILRWLVVPFLAGYIWFMTHMSGWTKAGGGFDGAGFARVAGQSMLFSLAIMLVANVVFPVLWKGVSGTKLAGAIDSFVANVPVLGARRKRVDRVKTLSSLASALTAGIPLSVAWDLATEAADTENFRRKMAEQSGAVRAGTPIPNVLAATGLHEDATIQMAHSGELAGNLPEMLLQAIYFQREEAQRIAQLTPWVIAIIAMFIIMGIMAYMVIYFGSHVYGDPINDMLNQTGS
jgi:type IV pilus assembly protein PilC